MLAAYGRRGEVVAAVAGYRNKPAPVLCGIAALVGLCWFVRQRLSTVGKFGGSGHSLGGSSGGARSSGKSKLV